MGRISDKIKVVDPDDLEYPIAGLLPKVALNSYFDL